MNEGGRPQLQVDGREVDAEHVSAEQRRRLIDLMVMLKPWVDPNNATPAPARARIAAAEPAAPAVVRASAAETWRRPTSRPGSNACTPSRPVEPGRPDRRHSPRSAGRNALGGQGNTSGRIPSTAAPWFSSARRNTKEWTRCPTRPFKPPYGPRSPSGKGVTPRAKTGSGRAGLSEILDQIQLTP